MALIELNHPITLTVDGEEKTFTRIDYPDTAYMMADYVLKEATGRGGEVLLPGRFPLSVLREVASSLPSPHRENVGNSLANLLDCIKNPYGFFSVSADALSFPSAEEYLRSLGLVSFIDNYFESTDMERHGVNISDGSIVSLSTFAERNGLSVDDITRRLASLILSDSPAMADRISEDYLTATPMVSPVKEDPADGEEEDKEDEEQHRALGSRAARKVCSEVLAASDAEVFFPDGLRDNTLNRATTLDGSASFTVLVCDGKPYIARSMFNPDGSIKTSPRLYSPSVAARQKWYDTSNGDEVTFDKDLNEKTRQPMEINKARAYKDMHDDRTAGYQAKVAKELLSGFKEQVSGIWKQMKTDASGVFAAFGSGVLTVARSNAEAAKEFILSSTASLRKAVTGRVDAVKSMLRDNRFIDDLAFDCNRMMLRSAGVDRDDFYTTKLNAPVCMVHVDNMSPSRKYIEIRDHASDTVLASLEFNSYRNTISNMTGSFSACRSLSDIADVVESNVMHPSNIESLRQAAVRELFEKRREKNPEPFNGWSTLERYEDLKGREYFMVYKPGDTNIPEGAYVTDNIEEIKSRLGGGAEIVHGQEAVEKFKADVQQKREEGYRKHLGSPVVVDVMESSTYIVRPYQKTLWSKEQQLAVRPLEILLGTAASLELYDRMREQITATLGTRDIPALVNDLVTKPDGSPLEAETVMKWYEDVMARRAGIGDVQHSILGVYNAFLSDGATGESVVLSRKPDGTISFTDRDGNEFDVTENGRGASIGPQKVVESFAKMASEKLDDILCEVKNVLIVEEGATARKTETVTEEHTEKSGLMKKKD